MAFFDTGLGGDGKVACATCHKPERAYSDGLAHASGVAGRQGARNTPSLLDVGRQRSLFWDGRRARLEDQALDPLLNRVEHGLADEAELLRKVRADARYASAIQAAYGVPAETVDLEVYNRGDRDARPLILTPVQRADLVAFLQSLTSDDLAREQRRAGR